MNPLFNLDKARRNKAVLISKLNFHGHCAELNNICQDERRMANCRRITMGKFSSFDPSPTRNLTYVDRSALRKCKRARSLSHDTITRTDESSQVK